MFEWGKFYNLSAILLSIDDFVNKSKIGHLNAYPAEGHPHLQIKAIGDTKTTIRKKYRRKKMKQIWFLFLKCFVFIEKVRHVNSKEM